MWISFQLFVHSKGMLPNQSGRKRKTTTDQIRCNTNAKMGMETIRDVEKEPVWEISATDEHGKLRDEVEDALHAVRRDSSLYIVSALVVVLAICGIVLIPTAHILDRVRHQEDGHWLTVKFASQKYENVTASQLALWQE